MGTWLDPRAARVYERLDALLGQVPGVRRLATAWALIAERSD